MCQRNLIYFRGSCFPFSSQTLYLLQITHQQWIYSLISWRWERGGKQLRQTHFQPNLLSQAPKRINIYNICHTDVNSLWEAEKSLDVLDIFNGGLKRSRRYRSLINPNPKVMANIKLVFIFKSCLRSSKIHSSAVKSFQHLWVLHFWRDRHTVSSLKYAMFFKLPL